MYGVRFRLATRADRTFRLDRRRHVAPAPRRRSDADPPAKGAAGDRGVSVIGPVGPAPDRHSSPIDRRIPALTVAVA